MTASPDATSATDGETSADDTFRGGSRFRRLYGAAPWNLLALLGCFALTGYAVSRLLDDLPVLVRIAVWFVGCAVVWDLLLGPALALVDRGLSGVLRGPAVNYVRVPAIISALLLLVWAPLILQRSEEIFRLKAGLTQDPYLERWLAVTAALFALSAIAFGVSRLRGRRRG